jgi:hypothetical protein
VGILAGVIVDEPVRGYFAYVEQPGLFSMPTVDQLQLYADGRVPWPPITRLSGLVVDRHPRDCVTRWIPASPWWQTAAPAGGTLAFVADAALACAVYTARPDSTMPCRRTCRSTSSSRPHPERAAVAKGSVIDGGARGSLRRDRGRAGNAAAHATS